MTEAPTPAQPRKGHWTSKFTRKPAEERTSPDGIVHDAAGEMARWMRLKSFEAQGVIDQLERQIPFPLTIPPVDGRPETPICTLKQNKRAKISKKTGKQIPAKVTGGRPIVYKLDFRYRDKDGILHGTPGAIIHEEYKGFMAEDAALKIAIVEARYGIKITIVKKA